jgi:hypothetical protein
VSPLARRRWTEARGRDGRRIPAHPYRDAALVYAAMAIVLVIVATTTGGDFLKAMLAALIFFALATGWSWWRFRVRIKERDAARIAAALTREAGTANGNGRGRAG